MTVSCDLVNYKKMVVVQNVILERYETLKIVKELSTGGKVCPPAAAFHINLT